MVDIYMGSSAVVCLRLQVTTPSASAQLAESQRGDEGPSRMQEFFPRFLQKSELFHVKIPELSTNPRILVLE